MKKFIINLCKKNHSLMIFLRYTKLFALRVNYIFLCITNKVDDKIIVFESYQGRQFSCSPKAIYNELLKDKKYEDYSFIWFFKDVEKYKYLEKNRNTKVIKFNSLKYYKYYAKAKYWISNSRINAGIIKKKKQVYIQCWHGTPLKKLGYDITVEGGNAMNTVKDIQKKYEHDKRRYTYMISPSSYCTEKFASAFNIKDQSIIKELGYPRNDFLYSYTKKNVKKIKESLNVPKDKKIILYAPTWRDNQHSSEIGYTYKLDVNFDLLKRNLQDEYVILFRAHYFIANSFNFNKYKGFVYNVSDYDDINELYIISDILITDYSSVLFDYASLRRPMIFYMYDKDEYQNQLRDFYIDLKELPGEIVYTETDLINAILDTAKFKYNKKYSLFNNKYNYLDGNASKKVIEECIK